jgi:hypothetical protein
MATFYEDIGKDFDDLQTKGFPSSGSFKVATETKTPRTTFNTAFSKSTKDKAPAVEATIDSKSNGTVADLPLEFETKLATSEKYSAKATFKDLLAKGSKISADIAVEGKVIKVGVTSSYSNQTVAFKIGAIAPIAESKQDVNAALSATFGGDFTAGAAVGARRQEGKDLSIIWGARATYKRADSQAIVRATSGDHGKNQILVSAGFSHKISSSFLLGVGASIDAQQKEGPKVFVLGDYKFDSAASLKAKAEFTTHPSDKPSDLRLNFGLKQLISPNLTATFGGDLNGRLLIDSAATGAGHSFGLELKFA